MKDETLETQRRIIEAIEALDDIEVEVTELDIKEYMRGDPTCEGTPVTGAEIAIGAYVSYDDEPDDENPYRYEP